MYLASLIAEIRSKLGEPTISELSDSSIEVAINSALDELSFLQPYYTYESIDIVRDVDTYSVGSDIIDVKGFWYSLMSDYFDVKYRNEFTVLGPGTPFNEYSGLKVFHSPSLMNVIEEKWEAVERRKMHKWEFNADTKELLMIPCPKKEGKGVYKGLIKRDLSTVPEKFAGPFKDLAAATSMFSWSTNISRIKSMPVGVGKIDYDTSGIIRSMNALRENALKRLKSGGSVVVIG